MSGGHGANIFKYSKDGKLIDFSSNINPFGPPKGVYENIKENLTLITRYPDVNYKKLHTAVSKYLGADESNISLGNGAMEVIDAIIRLHKKILVFNPCFSEYEKRARTAEKIVIERNLDENFLPDINDLPEDLRDTLVIVTSPHNPSGVALTREGFLELYGNIKRKGGRLLMDEVFYEFAGLDYDLAREIKNYDSLFVVRATTKFFSLPGLRLGYAISNEKEKIDDIIHTWSISGLLENLGDTIFGDGEFVKDSREKLANERERMIEAISKLKGFYPVSGSANFILIKTDYDNGLLFKYFLNKGILIRLCDNFKNLGRKYIRIAVKSPDDNDFLLKILKEFIYE